jgi:endonuclease G
MRVLFSCLVALVIGCASADIARRPSVFRARTMADDIADAPAVPHCFAGCPARSPDWEFGPTELIVRDGYALEHSSLDKIALWVAERVDRSQLQGSVPRRNKFAPDPQLSGPRAELADYRGSGYDRGHQAPAGNQTTDQRLKDETFFLSNMAPQEPNLNQQLWATLEDKTRVWVHASGHAYEITGGFFYDPQEENPTTADGIIDYTTIGPGDVAVPTHFYKIIIAPDDTGTVQAIAFVAANHAHQRPFDFATLIRSIDWIEERTGIDFMPGLSASEEARLEASPAALWP